MGTAPAWITIRVWREFPEAIFVNTHAASNWKTEYKWKFTRSLLCHTKNKDQISFKDKKNCRRESMRQSAKWESESELRVINITWNKKIAEVPYENKTRFAFMGFFVCLFSMELYTLGLFYCLLLLAKNLYTKNGPSHNTSDTCIHWLSNDIPEDAQIKTLSTLFDKTWWK